MSQTVPSPVRLTMKASSPDSGPGEDRAGGSGEDRLTDKGTTKTLTGTRYCTANGQSIAVRTATAATTGTSGSVLAADHHGTYIGA